MIIEDVVEEVSSDKAEMEIHGRGRTFDEGPSIGLELRKLGMGVVEIGDGDNPVIKPEVWKQVEWQSHYQAEAKPEEVEKKSGDKKACIGSNDQRCFSDSEQRAPWSEVAIAQSKLGRGRWKTTCGCGYVVDQIPGPAHKLLEKHAE